MGIQVCAEAQGNEYMVAAMEIMAKMSKDEWERYLYLRREMAYTDEMETTAEDNRVLYDLIRENIDNSVDSGFLHRYHKI